MKAHKKNIHRKFNNIVSNIVQSIDAKKYKVTKVSKDDYTYHGFRIRKIDNDCYTCTIDGTVLFDEIANFQLAISLCYNHLFKNSRSALSELHKLNKEVIKQKTDLNYYRHYAKTAEPVDAEFIYARMDESNAIYSKIKNDIRNLSISM